MRQRMCGVCGEVVGEAVLFCPTCGEPIPTEAADAPPLQPIPDGGLVAFEIKDAGQEDVFRVFEAMRLCTPATSLGDVYTLVLYPPMSTHRGMADDDRHAMGIADGLVRVSVGIEDIRDITADFDQALAAR